jgi:hexosaminidase
MKKTFISFAAFLAAGCMFFSCTGNVKHADYNVIPAPLEVTMGQEGAFVLTDGTKIFFPEGNEKMQRNAEFLAEYMLEQTGKTLVPQAGAEGNGIVLHVVANEEQPEGYNLR